jgi:hypothetical protein
MCVIKKQASYIATHTIVILLILHPSPLTILINKLKTKMLIEFVAIFLIAILGYAYNFIKPPPPLICASLGGPPVISPRIKLKDGRYLAYREFGVPKQKAKYKVVLVHGFDSSKGDPGDPPPASQVRLNDSIETSSNRKEKKK